MQKQYSTLFKLNEKDLKSEPEIETRLLAKLFKDLGINIRNFFKKGKISLGKPGFTGTRLSFSRKYLFAGQAV